MRIASDFPQSVSETFTATREQIVLPRGASYLIRRDDYPNPICIWNYHPEWEIHFIPDATGFAYVGDYIGSFRPGHLVLTGTNLPHNWITPGAPALPGRDMVLQFDADALIGVRSVCPEFDVLYRLKPLAQRGIEVLGKTRLLSGKILRLHSAGHRGGLGLFWKSSRISKQPPRSGCSPANTSYPFIIRCLTADIAGSIRRSRYCNRILPRKCRKWQNWSASSPPHFRVPSGA